MHFIHEMYLQKYIKILTQGSYNCFCLVSLRIGRGTFSVRSRYKSDPAHDKCQTTLFIRFIIPIIILGICSVQETSVHLYLCVSLRSGVFFLSRFFRKNSPVEKMDIIRSYSRVSCVLVSCVLVDSLGQLFQNDSLEQRLLCCQSFV